jgi:YD repeat-containing protein
MYQKQIKILIHQTGKNILNLKTLIEGYQHNSIETTNKEENSVTLTTNNTTNIYVMKAYDASYLFKDAKAGDKYILSCNIDRNINTGIGSSFFNINYMLGTTRLSWDEVIFSETENQTTKSVEVTIPNVEFDRIELRFYLNATPIPTTGFKITYRDMYLAKEDTFSGYQAFIPKYEEGKNRLNLNTLSEGLFNTGNPSILDKKENSITLTNNNSTNTYMSKSFDVTNLFQDIKQGDKYVLSGKVNRNINTNIDMSILNISYMLGNSRVGWNEVIFSETENKTTKSEVIMMPNIKYDRIELRFYLNGNVTTVANLNIEFEDLYLAKENTFSGYEPYIIENAKTYSNSYIYNNDMLQKITHNETEYNFIYDNFGNTRQVNVGNQNLITNNYEAGNGVLNNIVYGNGQTVDYTYDRFQRLTKQTNTNGTVNYTYDSKGNLGKTVNSLTGETENYSYDLADRLIKSENSNGLTNEYVYDANNNVTNRKEILDGTTNEMKYTYDKDNRITKLEEVGKHTITPTYDGLSRLTKTELERNGNLYNTLYTYKGTNLPNKTTTKIEAMKNGDSEELKYTYDIAGNIKTISKGTTKLAEYYYDELSQLTRENNQEINKTITYTYDIGGNITKKTEYACTEQNDLTNIPPTDTINYTYENTNWKDQLTSYNGQLITYDQIGNPLTYNGNTYTWQNGRQLGALTNQTNNLNISYKYNDSGIRTEKTVNGIATKYYLEGNNVIYEKTGTDTTYYNYDDSGNIIGLNRNGTQYYYIKNLQGDIIGILDDNLQQIVYYTYDSWGSIISIKDNQGNEITDPTNIGLINSYRYRSYRYDQETRTILSSK